MMRQKVFWFDLCVCSLWVLAVVADRIWRAFPAHFLVFTLITVMMRIILSFALYRREKRSWLPLIFFMVLFALLAVGGPVMSSVDKLTTLLFAVLCINNDHLTHNITKCVWLVWLFLGPFVVYIVEVCKKALIATNWTWKDGLGAILWKDQKARTYCQLMLIAIGALYVGLAMDMRMCRFGCLVLSPLSYCLLARSMNAVKCPSEGSQEVWKLGLMVIGMAIFFYAQHYAGIWRVWMLVTSILLVAYVCWQTFGRQRLVGRGILVTLYLGIILPTVTLGYNQYTCLEYSRWGYSTLQPLRGAFYIEDSKTGRIGLRDRYELLVKPVYKGIEPKLNSQKRGVYELRNNGYYTLYNVYRNKMMMSNVSDPNLQDSICQLLDKYFDDHDYGYRDRLEVRVIRKYNTEVLLAHVKMTRNRNNSYYDYSDHPYISEDTVTLRSGEFATDSIERFGDTYHVLRYSHDVKQDNAVLYRINVKIAKRSVPKHEELDELAKEIETLLKQ